MPTPAEQLEGPTLDNGWTVGPMIPRTPGHTGGHFSCAYNVSHSNGKGAFLKAMDYTSALSSADPAATLNLLTSAFLFEREVLQECADRKLTHIVKAIDGGKVNVGGMVVEYLVFEQARGDIRDCLDTLTQFNLTWTITCIHNICVGMRQLNGSSIAHQDLKPSNVLDFAQNSQKLADLGRRDFGPTQDRGSDRKSGPDFHGNFWNAGVSKGQPSGGSASISGGHSACESERGYRRCDSSDFPPSV